MPHPTRIADDVYESAQAVSAQEGRSTAEQINHWARLGREFSIHETAARSRVEAALAGTLAVDELDAAESRVYDAEVRAGIRERLQNVDFGSALAQRGIVTVALDDAGRMVEYYPDGSERIIAEAPAR
ncbi:ParD-like family protein [Tsukamurella sp. PLM1]|uniref:ParD-like family protein n=1 Tax=Tsukamurella sp. PLM1 TaxID=2929795 RepID=UPI0020694161|nr:ParD-like family protein [Tsukamurella sp. PLM1]BDH57956.1 hypothetical protein MTP03_28950 [Tsukamurella sp. PLM1]